MPSESLIFSNFLICLQVRGVFATMEFMPDTDIEVKNNDVNEAEDSNSRVYELGYLLVPTLEQEEIPAVYGNLKELLSSFKGEIILDEIPRKITLAYTMKKVISNTRNKFSSAYFGWIKFIMEPPKVLELKKHLDLDPNIIRFLILKTVKENTIASKRFIHGDARHTRPPTRRRVDSEPSLPINKEEIDKEIDALIAV